MSRQLQFADKQALRRVEPTQTKGQQPFSRVKSASAVTNDGKLFLFGGFDEDDNIDNNVYILNIATQEWSTHRHTVYREGHSALFVPSINRVIVYGGVPEENAGDQLSFIELLEYDLSSNQWINPAKPAFENFSPKERSRHAACLSNDGKKMFISGGLHKDSLNTPYDDLYCYDIETGSWDGPRTFVGRFDHTIIHYQDKIWSFGGLTKDMAHSSELSWFDLKTNTTGSIVINDLPKLEGDHIYLKSNNDSILLDVLVPLWTCDKTIEPCIALYDLNTLRWQSVLAGSFRPLLGYRWRHTFINGSNLYLLGYPLTQDTDDSAFDYKLVNMISINLSDLGISSQDDASQYVKGSIVSDLSNLLFDQQFTDFEIVGIEGDERASINSSFLENTGNLKPPFANDQHKADTFIKSQPLKVHKTILLSRWPHFRKIIESGMLESQTNSLFIPEPIGWLKLLIEYLYTDQLRTKEMNTITGLLILSNLFELPQLRLLCIEAIYAQGLKIKNVLKVWTRAKLLNEEVLAHNAATFCFHYWGKIVKTKQFRDLSKDELITLCREVGQDGMILNHNLTATPSRTGTPQQNLHHSTHTIGYGDENDFILNRYGSFRYSSGFVPGSSAPMFGLETFMGLGTPGGIGGHATTNDDNGTDDDDDEESNEENELNSVSSLRTRLTTPQASIFGNPQSAMNSLGERDNEDEGEDDTDMEDTAD